MITLFLDSAITRSTRALRLSDDFSLEPLAKADSAGHSAVQPVSVARTRNLPLTGRPARERGRLGQVLFKGLRATFRALVYFHIWYVCTTTLLVACFGFVDPAATTLSVYRKYVDGWKIVRPVPTELKKIPKTARRMLVSIEDYKFYDHFGIDFEAFERAIEVNQKIGRPMYGGSTLTMQTARTLFLVPVKSYVRKYLEVIVAFELEILLSKDRILELYFSWAEWGKGVFGIEAASKKYYKVSVAKLGASQMASLMAVLSSPIRYTPATLAKSGLLSWRYEFLLDRYVR